jgi:hypothetical protein
MLQGTIALQFGFRIAGRNPEVLEQQLRDTKYTLPAICQQNANITVSGNLCKGIWKKTPYSKKMDIVSFFQHHPPYHRIISIDKRISDNLMCNNGF